MARPEKRMKHDRDELPSLRNFPISSLRDVAQFDRSFPSFRLPEEIGTFSLSQLPGSQSKRQYHDDCRALKPLRRRGKGTLVSNISLNLDHGFHSWIRRVKEKGYSEHIDHLLEWILHHPQNFLLFKHKINLVCWRGKLHELMTTPYSQSDRWNNGWIICVCKIDGILYLSSFENDAAAAKRLGQSQQDSKFEYWGFKFEQYMTTDPADREVLKEPVTNFDGFHSVLYSKLGETGILFGGEMDCFDPNLDPKTTSAPATYVELKTSRLLSTDNQRRQFCSQKLLKFWAQSFVAGVPTIVIGFRNDQGNVSQTEELRTQDISKIVKSSGEPWSPAVCVNFLNDFLTFVRRTAVEEYDKAVYRFVWCPGWEKVEFHEEAPDSKWKFIPDWYIRSRPGRPT
ncbi:hypothetical protein RvY_07596 [Ramazzottius varieornatus]|uniref:Decapping nuclease n=1 Tax=Ramazzottius varieornatus TaxID=947166 RepID=A0A1D1V2R7_RAMVA|nr:hypothetical protein RvY_07596 [Ramazzottius varieornatus]